MIANLKESVARATGWLTEIAQVKDNQPIGRHGEKMPTTFWHGAIQGEYRASTKQWGCLCPIWHTGQTVKALVMAVDALNRPELLKAAEFSAEFIMHNRVMEGSDQGLILAFEDNPDKVNTSAMLESIDGLFYLSEANGDMSYKDAAISALRWVANNAWQPEDKLFNDIYDPDTKEFLFGIRGSQGRPLLDDAVF
ncbi:MAG: hypothetical protein L3J71_07015 [Victivallaceae bacterium]|nr:hypothetical protein [Victivallaceae bacterium]